MRSFSRVSRSKTLSTLAVMFSLAILIPSLAPIARVRAQETPVKGGVLREAISEEPDQLDPARTIELLAYYINTNIYDALVYIGDDGLPHPWIAESWTISPDSLTITFKIRQGVKFHDGTALDAPAIKFGYDRILDPAMAAPYKSFLGSLQSVDAPDATTLNFHFAKPYAPFFTNGATIAIVSPAGVQKWGKDFGHHPVGSGPFMFKEWVTGSKIVLVRNPNYVNYRADDSNKGAPYVDELDYNVISEAATQTAAFESNELDILSVPREDVARLSQESGVKIVSLEKTHNINFIEFANRPPFNNEYFRKAVAYAIDHDSINQIAYLGNATTNLCPVPIGDAAYDANLCAQHGYAYDLNKAKQMLQQGGFKPEDLKVTLWSYAPYPVQAKTIQIIQADLNKIGFQCSVQTIEFGAEQPKLESGEIGFDYMRWTFSDQSILSALFKSPGWVKQTSNPDLDKLIEVADTTVDPAKRLDATHAAMTYILDHAIIAPVNSDWLQAAIHNNVHNYHWDALANEQLVDVWLSK